MANNTTPYEAMKDMAERFEQEAENMEELAAANEKKMHEHRREANDLAKRAGEYREAAKRLEKELA